MDDTTPMYNLKAVVNEVGLTPATLRAWERRYEIIKPMRTAGGHRLYSRKDIEVLKWLVKRQNEGVSISQAVEMWNQLNESDQAPLVPAPLHLNGTGETILDGLRENWLADCMAFNELAANRTLDQAFAIAPPEAVCIEVLQRGLAQIGTGWYVGTVSVQQEHFTSSMAARRINTLLAAAPAASRPGRILATCPPGEEHEFPLLLATYLLRRGGWDVVYLGADVPLEDLDKTLEETSAKLIVSSAQTLEAAASLRRMTELALSRGIPTGFGGGIFMRLPGTTGAIPGHYLGDDIARVAQAVEQLLSEQAELPTAGSLPPGYAQTLSRFSQRKGSIADYVTQRVEVQSISPTHLERANMSLTRLIESALALGNINFLDASSEWLNGLLKNHGLPEAVTRRFYSVYSLGVVHYLGQDGGIILDWLGEQIFQADGQTSRE